MTPFNPNATCPKCGGGDARSVWFKREHPVDEGKPLVVDGVMLFAKRAAEMVSEHIARHCTTCGYSWPEAPLDREEDRWIGRKGDG